MTEQTLEAMCLASKSFVDMEELQRKLGRAAAELTHNEAAYFTNGAAGALTTAAAVCMAKGSAYRFARLPGIVPGTAPEIIRLHCQHNAYDKAVEVAGAQVVDIGDADETLEFDLEGAINERTAAVFYYASTLYARAAMPLEDVIRIAHSRGVPVVVDAAAQLPPVENLWRFTGMGADMVIFSGGKTLCGPQDSGLIVGKKQYIEDCIRFGAPMHGVCRGNKSSRESMGAVQCSEAVCGNGSRGKPPPSGTGGGDDGAGACIMQLHYPYGTLRPRWAGLYPPVCGFENARFGAVRVGRDAPPAYLRRSGSRTKRRIYQPAEPE